MKRPRLVVLPLVIAALAPSACGPGAPSTDGHVIARPGESVAQEFPVVDEEMAEAMKAARASFDKYVAAVDSPAFSAARRSVKVPVTEGAGSEYVWLSKPVVADGKVSGTIANRPLSLTSVKHGDKVEVPVDEIGDWMLIVDGELYGGFTIVLQRSRMTAEERVASDAELRYRVPDEPRLP